jgi:ABC-2 type transport system ATP-binding protein
MGSVSNGFRAGSGPIIQVENVRRVFRSTKKEEGWKGAFQLLLRPSYQEHEALRGVSFSVEPGSFVGLIGANGAGKTTILKILSGLIPPTSGTARVLGVDPFRRELGFRSRISLVMGKKAQLWWDLPAVDAFELLRAIYEIPERVYQDRLKMLTSLLDVGRHLHTQIRRLSLGERMKMELIGALLHWPSVVFLDEPTIGLDVLAAHKLREFLRVFNQQEKATIILTSHNMDDIERLCSRVLIMRTGELIYDGSPQRLVRHGESRLRVRLMTTPSVSELARVTQLPESAITIGDASSGAGEAVAETGEAEEAGSGAGTIHLCLPKERIVRTLQELMGQFQIVDMGIEEQSLESVIQRLYEGQAG